MVDEMIEKAANNNAEWCDIICDAHGLGGSFTGDYWINTRNVPKYYPNFITLKKSSKSPEVINRIRELMSTQGGVWTVKDSFADLELDKLGFSRLFDAQWILALEVLVSNNVNRIECRKVITNLELKAWEKAWSPKEHLGLFSQSLLKNSKVKFYACYQNGLIVAGAIINISEAAIGISNIFCNQNNRLDYIRGIVRKIKDEYKNLPLVGYEHGTDLNDALEVGFTTVGKLTVWKFNQPTHGYVKDL